MHIDEINVTKYRTSYSRTTNGLNGDGEGDENGENDGDGGSH